MTDFIPPWVKYDDTTADTSPSLQIPVGSDDVDNDSVPPVPVTSSTAAPAGPTDWAEQLQRAALDAAESALHDAAPQIQDQISKYTQNYITGVLTGGIKPDLTYTATTLSGKELTIASAKNRSWRTFLQGMGLDIVFALVALIGTLGHVNFFTQAGLITLSVLIVKTIVQTVISYVARVKITPPYER